MSRPSSLEFLICCKAFSAPGEAVIKDIRTFIARLEKAGELERVTAEVDWKYDLGAMARRAQKSRSHNPALLFERIKDYEGYRVFVNGLGSYARIAIALGLEPATSLKDIVGIVNKRITCPLEPLLVESGPVKEHILKGKEVDLEKLPVPWYGKEDAGRYIGTWHINITRDPETGIRNLGIYRMQLLDSGKTAISVSPKGDLAVHIAKAQKRGKPLEMAVAIGVDELLIIAAAASPPYGTDEYCIAGGLSQEPVSLCRCVTVDLEVPVSAEIVLEGTIDPQSSINEGPFLDYTGVPRGDPHAFIFEVSCLMYRENPIFRGAAIGEPGAEDHLLFSLLASVDCLDFHGSRIRQRIQNALVKNSFFRLFQYTGRFRNVLTQFLQRR
jgi:4-hydroxy-3-polyprenylbenzoate decarboxylase